jgi:HSP20 family protein
MFNRKSTELARRGELMDPFALLSRVTSDFDRMFEESGWPAFRTRWLTESTAWSPSLDIVEKDNRLIARVDLPGMKKEDVKVEVVEGRLTISGERKHETEEKKENFYRCEREYGSFYRAVPLPDGAQLDGVKASFENGVLEVTVPLAARAANKGHTVAIEEPAKTATKTKAA